MNLLEIQTNQIIYIVSMLIAVFIVMINISNTTSIFMKANCVAGIFLLTGSIMLILDVQMNFSSMILYILLFFYIVIYSSYTQTGKKAAFDQIYGIILLFLLYLIVFYAAYLQLNRDVNHFNAIIYMIMYIPFLLSLFFTSRMSNSWCKLFGIMLMHIGTVIFIILYFSPYSSGTTITVEIYETLYYCLNFEKNINDDMKLIRLIQYGSYSLLNMITFSLILSLIYTLWHHDNKKTE